MAEFIEVMEMILENVTEIAEVLFAVIGVAGIVAFTILKLKKKM